MSTYTRHLLISHFLFLTRACTVCCLPTLACCSSHLIRIYVAYISLFAGWLAGSDRFRMVIWRWAEPKAQILGGPDLYVDKGSTINLTCTIRFGAEPPGYIFWYHENKVRAHTPPPLPRCATVSLAIILYISTRACERYTHLGSILYNGPGCAR